MVMRLVQEPTLYFGYGSNLWRHQMLMRCPTSQLVGVARLPNWRWIINDRGYANVVEHTSKSKSLDAENEVWGLVYTLQPEDEAKLDANEGVPIAYTKEMHDVEFWAYEAHNSGASRVDQPVHDAAIDLTKPPKLKSTLIYVNRKRTGEAAPKHEYIYRMNKGIEDALKLGVPKSYVDNVLRRFIPKGIVTVDEAEAEAHRQAVEFKDDAH